MSPRDKELLEKALVMIYLDDRCDVAVARACDEILDPSGALLGRVRKRAEEARKGV